MAEEQVTSDMEGTSSDLRSIPVIGALALFLRGLQRPTWGFGILFADYMWLSGVWDLDEPMTDVIFLVNFLVLGFLFGERAIKNLEPLITKLLAK